MDDDDSKLSRRKLVQGAAALATFLATGAAPKASQAAYVANEGSRVRGTVLQGDPFNGALR